MLKKMNIKKKMILGFAVVIAMILGLGGLTIYEMNGISREAQIMSNMTIPKINIGSEAERTTRLMRFETMKYSYSFDEHVLAKAKELASTMQASNKKGLQIAEETGAEDLRDAINIAEDLLVEYMQGIATIEEGAQKSAEDSQAMGALYMAFLGGLNQYLEMQESGLQDDIASGSVEKVHDRHLKIVEAKEIGALGASCRIINLESIANRDPEHMKLGLETLDEIMKHIDRLRDNTTKKENLECLNKMRKAAVDCRAAESGIIAAWKLINDGLAMCVKSGVSIQELTSGAQSSGLAQATTFSKDSVKTVQWANTLNIIGLIAASVIAMLIAFVITRGIVKPIESIVDRIKDIAQGEGDLTKRVEVDSKDEIGELARWFNTFVEKVRGIVSEVSDATGDVAATSTEIAASAEEMAQGMQEQRDQVTQVSTAVEEMSSSVIEVAQKAADANRLAEEANRTADEGGSVVQDTVQGINEIATVVSESSVAVGELREQGEKIGQIVEVINDVADQTNLLALNAAIEAARAGEHGRGFAVVADEVRKLADRTTKATDDISNMIQTIQEGTNSAVERMNSGDEIATRGVELAQRAGQSLDQIVEGSGQVTAMVQNIAAAAEEQSAASEQISNNISSISAVIQQSAEGANQASQAALTLSEKSERLQSIVGQFKISA
ncbi:Methyl-accepting chemotaxis protein PctC [Poriferisphaera corsica]|uniref:Methyl-accepting chemotaxis protein PctC n=1 Tax=Poriferisphaera corsica TaxID=2528020 RepID=A0A517YTY4_9BACT|nr:methyl-accepting chemotaxis protein [Poriferisphaera corsica]QDU33686.1 Methyl-accepting chemotaxis protein PctC [Poriferisphaera corsica]